MTPSPIRSALSDVRGIVFVALLGFLVLAI